jgi:predicted nucleic acid-binding protein
MTIARPIQAVVVDASSMVEVLSGDEVWLGRLEQWQEQGALLLAPTHFRAEMANALLLSMKVPAVEAVSRLQRLFSAGVDVVDRGFLGLFDAIELAAKHGLTVYDAAYLSLVLDVHGELATLDKALIRAAHAEGVPVVS